MLRGSVLLLAMTMTGALIAACSNTPAPSRTPWHLSAMVAPIQGSVVTVAAFDATGDMSRIGSGFFIDRDGTLVTNLHLLDGAYKAEIKTSGGERFPVQAVLGRSRVVDLVKVRVEIPSDLSIPVMLSEEEPAVADRVVVIGSPLGFDQTISEGIVSAVREHGLTGKVYQLTAPISPGFSGGPALNHRGEVFGVVAFQAAKGQNLNFAISIQSLRLLMGETEERSLTEWRLKESGKNPALAASLCRQGTQLSIRGEYEAALDYFQQAAKTNPDDPDAWQGLGSCYIGLNQPDNAIAAYQRVINTDPENGAAYFILAMYYKTLEQYQLAIDPLKQVIRINGKNLRARMELADTYGKLERTDEQIDSFEAILKISPDHVPSLHQMGQLIGRIGRHDEALNLLLKASALSPNNAGIHFDVGLAYRSKNLPEKELQAYTRAIRANPRMVSAHYHLGLLFLGQGNRKLALQQYEVLKTLDIASAERFFRMIYPQSLKEVTTRHSIKY
jgi:tetratricopeptide (TPR) repeat protein